MERNEAQATKLRDEASMCLIEVVMAAYNRREDTLRSLASVFAQATHMPVQLHVVLLDDDSPDDTGGAIARSFPQVEIIMGSGQLFWCGGMRVAFQRAMTYNPDYFLLLNDDTALEPDSLQRLLDTAREIESMGKPAIIAGSTFDLEKQRCSYGGYVFAKGLTSRRFVPIEPDAEKPQRADTMNGNCVLLPREIVCRLGNLDKAFIQQYGDFDYGLRAKNAGYDVWLIPGFVGACANNSIERTWRDPRASFQTRWKSLTSNKGVPWRQWIVFTRRHFGYMWPFYCLSPYVKTLLKFGLGKGSRL